MTSRWYDTSDSEREQPGWRVPASTSRAAERALRKQRAKEANKDYSDTETESDTSARDTDDDSLLENMAVAARRATRAKPGYRRWHRPARGDRSRIDEAQSRWDAAMATPLSSGGDSPLGGDDDDEAQAVVGVTGASGKEATGGSAVAGEKRDRRATGPPTDDVSGGDFRSRLKRRAVRFGAGAGRGEAAAAESAERQSFPYEGARGGAAASQGCRRDGRRRIRPSEEVSQAVRRRSPVGMPRRDGKPPSGRRYLRSGVPDRGDCRNQGRARLTSLAAGAKAAAHEGAPQTTRKDEQIGAGERRVVPTEHGVEAAADATTEGREQADAAGAEGRQCEARPSRVQRVADFAAWAEKVTEGVRAPHSGEPKRKRRWSSSRREVDGAATGDAQGQGTTAPLGEAATADVETDGGARDAARAAEKAMISKPSARQDSSAPPGIQIGAGGRRTVPAGHGFGVTSTIDEVVGDDERNDEAARQRRLAAAAGGASGRRTPEEPTDDEARKRRRTLASERGRGFLGSRRQDAEMATSRQRERWIARLDEMGVLPKGEERAAALRSLGAQRQRADAYAAAAARAAPKGAGRPTPVAAGTSVPDGLEPPAAAAASLDEMIKLPTYSMARIASESDDFVLRAPFPVTNVSPEDDPMPPVPEASELSPDPDWRPSALTDVYTVGGIKRIMAWFEEMRRYEAAAVAKSGSGLTRPDDLVLGDEYVQPEARGRPWYLIDHIRTGGASPIVPLEEASPLAPAINGERVRSLGKEYHDKRVLDQLCDGHRNLSKCPPVTVLSANHSGALRFHDAVGKQFADDSAEEVGWLQPVVSAETPLVLQLGDERVKISGFVATCPARIEPCNGVQQNGKVRTTTDKSWPKLEVLPDGSEELAVNPLIALDELAKSEFPKTTQFAAGVAVLMQAEPAVGVAGVTRDREAAASPADYVYLWKIDLQSAYRSWHNHPSELWMFGKQWGGESYLDCRTQFGDASMVQDFSRFTDFFLWLLRRLADGDERLRRQCDSFGAPLWAALDAEPTSKEYSNWLLERTAAGLDGDHLRLSVEAGYIDDIFGAALGYDRAAAMRDLAVGLAKFLGFDVAPKKIAGPTSQMTVLGASLTLQTRILALDPDKALSYEAQVSEALKRKSSMRMTDFLSLTCKLVHAAQYRPAGRPYLTCMFTAMRQATRSGAKRVRPKTPPASRPTSMRRRTTRRCRPALRAPTPTAPSWRTATATRSRRSPRLACAPARKCLRRPRRRWPTVASRRLMTTPLPTSADRPLSSCRTCPASTPSDGRRLSPTHVRTRRRGARRRRARPRTQMGARAVRRASAQVATRPELARAPRRRRPALYALARS